MARARDLGIVFTCCPSTSLVTSPWKDARDPDHAIRRMIEAGLIVTINTDDPPMFDTDLTKEFGIVARDMQVGPQMLKQLALNSLRGSWLDEPTKGAMLGEWSAEIDRLVETHLQTAAA
jgi:adenosine deaminase